MITVTYPFGF